MTEAVTWDHVQPKAMPAFLDRFTLHDSSLHGLTIADDGSVVVEMHFDLVWNTSIPTGFDTLVFKFDRPYRVRWVQGSWSETTVGHAESAALDPAARASLLDDADFDLRAHRGTRLPMHIPHPAEDETVTCTRVHFINTATLEILHGASVRFVVLDSGSRTIDVSTVQSAAT